MNKLLYGVSIGDIDVALELPEDFRKLLRPVLKNTLLSVWYLASGHFWISPDLGVTHLTQQGNPHGQVLLQPKGTDIVWHFATISHNRLYGVGCQIKKKEPHILLHLSRRTPILDQSEFEKRLGDIRRTEAQVPPAPLEKQQNPIGDCLPKLCTACGNETDTLHPVPDEDEGVCPTCLASLYARCSDCERVILREGVRYVDERVLCSACHHFAESMGFI